MKPRKRHHYTEVERELVRRNYANSLTADLATVLGLTIGQVHRLASKLGVEKDRSLIAEVSRQKMADPKHGARHHQFPKGHVPANKGRKTPGFAPGRMGQTQFKPGQRASNWMPIGAYRINGGGLLQRKVADVPHAPPSVNWRCVHELLWIEAHGPVPPGHYVVFKPGRRTNVLEQITLDAVELISRADNARRNSVHRLPEPLKQVVRLRSALTRQINKRARREEPASP